MEKKDVVFEPQLREINVLENLGYAQELKRTFSLPGMVGFAFSIVTSWSALGGVLVVGVESGGPPVMIFSFLAISILTLAVAFSMAEICSAYPVAGGQYSWVIILAPKSIARGLSWMTGWFMITGILAMAATVNFITANFILGMANLTFPDYVIEPWHVVLLAYLVAWISAVGNIYTPQWLERTAKIMVTWNIASFFVVIITILACNDHKQSASFVFTEFQNLTGWGPAMAAILGVLQAAFGMCCYDAPAHMTEEMLSATTEAPKSIILSVLLGGVTGTIFLIAVSFCIGDFEGVASSSTGVPLIQIFYDSTNSVGGACVLTVLLVVPAIVSAVFLTAEGSRSLYAFARDRGLPFSHVWAKMALNSIYFGALEAFSTVIAIATEGFYLSYFTPMLAVLLARLSNRGKTQQLLCGPYQLGRWGWVLNLISAIFLLFASITFNFPGIAPVTAQNMNYTSAAIGIIGLISLVTWIFDGRKNFTGPRIGSEEVGVREAVDGSMDEGKKDIGG